ncbi:MAG: CYTH domain-containing protein [Candidatus Paceibacterota bacterium]
MEIEYEATFLNIDKNEIRKRLKNTGAILLRPEYLQKRIPFNLPKETHSKDKFVRVRDEGDKITMSFKMFDGDKIENQKEICLTVNDFNDAVDLLTQIGCEPKSYQESKRELWKLDNVEIMIDEWPFLEPFIEIEGKSEKDVKKVSEKLGFDYSKALFCPTGKIYQMKYNIPENKINTIPKIVFDMKNPFL